MAKFRKGDKVKHLGSYWTGIVISYSDKYSRPVCNVKRDDGVAGGGKDNTWVTWEENIELIESAKPEEIGVFEEIVKKWSKKKRVTI